jgi:uncharacterized damage-inducible protein DinB
VESHPYYAKRVDFGIVSELDSIREWFAYNARARQGYFETFSKLPPGELAKDRGASYPTLQNILEHTLGAYHFWFSNMSKESGLPRFGPIQDTIENPPLDEIAQKENPSLEELVRLERAIQAQVDLFLGGLVEGDLRRTFSVPTAVASHHRDPRVSVRDVLWHLVEEELQHRGELNALLWQMDVDAPIFDWIDWSSLKSKKA